MTQTAAAPETRTHAENLDQLAAVAVNVGLGLKPGQELVMTASLDSLPLARRITEQAYRAGASLVTTLFTTMSPRCCAIITRPTRASTTPPSGFTTAWPQHSKAAPRASPLPEPIPPAFERGSRQGGPRQSRRLAGLPSRSRAHHASRNQLDHRAPAPRPPGLRPCFPTTRPMKPCAKLWDAIFATTRINTADPVSAWKAHDAESAQARRLPE